MSIAVGTLVQGDSVIKTNSGITSRQQRKGAISATISITFTPDGTLPHIKASWGAGTVAYSDGTTEAVASSNTGSLTASTTYFVYKIEGNTALQFSTTFTDAMGDDRVYLGQFLTQAAADPTADSAPMIRLIFGSSDAVLNVGHLSAIVANLGAITAGSLDAVSITGSTITGGTVKTGASGARVEMNSSDGLKAIDSSDDVRVQIPTAATQILLRSDSDAGKIEFRDSLPAGTLRSEIFSESGTANLEILPGTASSGYVHLGKGTKAWQFIGISTEHTGVAQIAMTSENANDNSDYASIDCSYIASNYCQSALSARTSGGGYSSIKVQSIVGVTDTSQITFSTASNLRGKVTEAGSWDFNSNDIDAVDDLEVEGDIDLAGDLDGTSDSVLIGRHKLRKSVVSAWSAGDIGADEIVFEWTSGGGAYLLIKENVTVWEVALTAR